MKMFCWLDLLSLILTISPAVAPQMKLQRQGQDVNIQHLLPQAHSQSIAVTQKIAIYLRIQFPLSWCDTCSKYSCSLLCCPMSIHSGKILVNNRLSAEGLWGDNPFSASPNTFLHYYSSSCTAVTPQTPLQKLFSVSVATSWNYLSFLHCYQSSPYKAVHGRSGSPSYLLCHVSHTNPRA